MKRIIIELAVISALMMHMQLQGGITKISNTQDFTTQLKAQKRVVAVIVDTAQLKDNASAISAKIDAIGQKLSETQEYRISRIGFIVIDVAHLPQNVQTDLRTAIGGSFKEPIAVVLFENGSLYSDNGLFISQKELQEDGHNAAVGIGRLIEQNWGSYIEHCLYKCQNADARRAFTHAHKVQVSLAASSIDQSYYVDDQSTTYDSNYNPAQWGYDNEPAYENSSGNVYYNYPYYNGGYGSGVGLGVGLGLGTAAWYGGNYYRGGYYGHHHGGDYHHHGGGGYRHGGGFHGGGGHRGGHGRR